MSSPQGPRNIRILKRDPAQKEILKPISDSGSSQPSSEIPPGATTEEDYAKVGYPDMSTLSCIHLGESTHIR